MPGLVVVGAQWGDEGKGKVTDLIAERADVVIRYQGGNNAGQLRLGEQQTGTPRRGIGPCYADKAARLGIRMQDLLDEKILKQKIYAALEPKRLVLRPYAKDPELDLHAMTEEYRTLGHRLEPYIADTAHIVWDALDARRLVIFEGAQGTLLDIDPGPYPFVTSSNPV